MPIDHELLGSTTIGADLVVTRLLRDYLVSGETGDADETIARTQAALLLAVSGLEQRVNALMKTIRVPDDIKEDVVRLNNAMRKGSLPETIG